jgi:hypothetical protein
MKTAQEKRELGLADRRRRIELIAQGVAPVLTSVIAILQERV